MQGSFDRFPDTRLLATYPQVAFRCGTQHQHAQLLLLRLPQLPQRDADLFFGRSKTALDLLPLGRGSALGLLLLTLTRPVGCLLLGLLCLGQLDLQVCCFLSEPRGLGAPGRSVTSRSFAWSSYRSASRSLLLTVLAFFDFAAEARAFAAAARLSAPLRRYSPAFFSASVRALFLRSS
ncbi:hypothetical protein [Streptomyces sp. NPDC002132]|uniref:hypothetical protein n=1 Tax=unclassified Streptomyces TaxID=2593676 RepID=UPI00332F8F9D